MELIFSHKCHIFFLKNPDFHYIFFLTNGIKVDTIRNWFFHVIFFLKIWIIFQKLRKKTFLELVQFHPNYVSRQLLKRTNPWFKYGLKWMITFGAMTKRVHWIFLEYFTNIRGKLLTNLYFGLLFFSKTQNFLFFQWTKKYENIIIIF